MVGQPPRCCRIKASCLLSDIDCNLSGPPRAGVCGQDGHSKWPGRGQCSGQHPIKCTWRLRSQLAELPERWTMRSNRVPNFWCINPHRKCSQSCGSRLPWYQSRRLCLAKNTGRRLLAIQARRPRATGQHRDERDRQGEATIAGGPWMRSRPSCAHSRGWRGRRQAAGEVQASCSGGLTVPGSTPHRPSATVTASSTDC